ncbi:hypothetical protein DLM_3683 [Aquitalea magnusonii]|uniref:DUF1484 domain-containing protein n=1 Tax=Aquitalea magnusonii TaxID=332411 RepID=A0A3G9GR91_9NEIS|nr:DUF1484 family protein [Aquitalea magnusonii]BBF87267.1 hypothetical protein DLM_3683 [Aquitalea magnusonii]
MNTQQPLSQPAPAAYLALATFQDQLGRLQTLTSLPEHAALREPISQLTRLSQTIQHTIADGICTLDRAADCMQCLLDLLYHAEDMPLAANQLAGLLTPLHQQISLARTDIGQLL